MFSILENKVFLLLLLLLLLLLRASFMESKIFCVCVWLWSYSPTQKASIYALIGFQTSDPKSQAAADPHLIPHGLRDLGSLYLLHVIKN